jgi:hypothetical protein
MKESLDEGHCYSPPFGYRLAGKAGRFRLILILKRDENWLTKIFHWFRSETHVRSRPTMRPFTGHRGTLYHTSPDTDHLGQSATSLPSNSGIFTSPPCCVLRASVSNCSRRWHRSQVIPRTV